MTGILKYFCFKHPANARVLKDEWIQLVWKRMGPTDGMMGLKIIIRNSKAFGGDVTVTSLTLISGRAEAYIEIDLAEAQKCIIEISISIIYSGKIRVLTISLLSDSET